MFEQQLSTIFPGSVFCTILMPDSYCESVKEAQNIIPAFLVHCIDKTTKICLGWSSRLRNWLNMIPSCTGGFLSIDPLYSVKCCTVLLKEKYGLIEVNKEILGIWDFLDMFNIV